jgi:hypothetical protein
MTTRRIVPIVAPVTEAAMRRFWAKVVIDPSGCLIWTAGTGGNGYGRFAHGGRQVQAHRFAYTTLVGPIPDGLVVDHLCRNRACVAPDHLEPVTNRENLLRGVGPSAVAAAKTHCDKGHPFDEANTWTDKRGKRRCRTCDHSAQVARRESKRDEVNAWKRAWYAANRESVRAQQNASYAANREARAAAERVRSAARRNRKAEEARRQQGDQS